MRLIIRSLAIWVTIVGLVATSTYSNKAYAQSPNVTVSVEGTGATIDDAYSDAIRKALQLTMKQLVVVDRAVSENDVLRDKVMSTMNGYVESFQKKSIDRSANGYTIAADITVSASRIENFIGVTMGGGGEIRGSAILGEQSRRAAQKRADELQAKARGEIFDRLFRGFPSDVIDLKVISTSLSETSDKIIDVHIEIAYKNTFIKSLMGTIKALGGVRCDPESFNFGTVTPTIKVAKFTQNNSCAQNYHSKVVICVGHGQSEYGHDVQCYGMPFGYYCADCRIKEWLDEYPHKYFTVASRFIDSSGQSANLGGDCNESIAFSAPIVLQKKDGRINVAEHYTDIIIERGEDRGENYLTIGFDISPKRLVIAVPTSRVDLHRAKSLVGVVSLGADDSLWKKSGIFGPIHRWLTSLVPNTDGEQRKACDLLDEAAQKYMLIPENIRTTSKSSRGWLGILIQDVTKDLAESFGMEQPGGVLVSKVIPDSPAEKAQLMPGDIILEFDGSKLMNSSELPPLVSSSDVGKPIKLSILRNGRNITLDVTLGVRPTQH